MSQQQVIQNIVGGTRRADMNVINMSECQNMYFETSGEGASSSSLLRSIKGLDKVLDIDGIPRGRFVASRGPDGNPRLFVVYYNKLYVIDKDTDTGLYIKTFVGNLSNITTPVGMCETGGEGSAHPYIVVVDGSTVHIASTIEPASTIASTFRNITLPLNTNNQYIQPTHCAYQYGYLCVNDNLSDGFYQSYQYPFETTDTSGNISYDVFTYDPLSDTTAENGFVTYAEWMPDNITAMIGTGSRMVVLGKRSYQSFHYNNDINQPFVSADTAASAIGIQAIYSLATIGSFTFWLGASDIGQNAIYVLDVDSINRISNPDIEREISAMTNASDAVAQCWVENGHMFYSLTFITDNKTITYDVLEKKWHSRVSTDPNKNISNAWRYNYAVMYDNKIWFLTTGALCIQTNDSWLEHDGNPIIRLRICGAIINDYSPFMIDSLFLFINNGYTKNPIVRPKLMLRFSRDGTSFSNERIGYMGRQGEYSYVTEFTRLGMGRIWNFEISCSENIDFTLMSAKILANVCGRF